MTLCHVSKIVHRCSFSHIRTNSDLSSLCLRIYHKLQVTMNQDPDSTATEEAQISDASKRITTHDTATATSNFCSTFDNMDPYGPLQAVHEQPHNRIKSYSFKRDKRKIFVGGLPMDLTDSELRQAFEMYGPLVDSVVMMDKVTNRSRGFGFVTFEDARVAQYVLDSECIAHGTPLPPGGCRSGRFFIKHKWCEVKAAEPKESSSTSTGSPHSQTSASNTYSSSPSTHPINNNDTGTKLNDLSSPILQPRARVQPKIILPPANTISPIPNDLANYDSSLYHGDYLVDGQRHFSVAAVPYPLQFDPSYQTMYDYQNLPCLHHMPTFNCHGILYPPQLGMSMAIASQDGYHNIPWAYTSPYYIFPSSIPQTTDRADIIGASSHQQGGDRSSLSNNHQEIVDATDISREDSPSSKSRQSPQL